MARDPYRFFRIEARDLLESLSNGVLALERAPSIPAAVKELLRLAHTLKGASRVVNQVEIADLAHSIEDVLSPFREGDALPSRDQVGTVLELLDRASAKLSELEPATAPGKSARAAEEPFDSVRVAIGDLDHVVRGVFEAGVQAKGLGEVLTALEKAGDLAGSLHEQLASPRFGGAMSTPAGQRVLSLAGGLRNALERTRRELGSHIEHTEVELAQVRDDLDQLRLLPAGNLIGTLERAARDAGTAAGKLVEFEASGADIQLDAHALRALREAMVHLVRNAVAHGIEPAAERQRSGKRPAGRVSVAFEKRGPRVSFICGDDGRGIDVAAVAAEAHRRGILPGGEPLDTQKAIALLLRGGLSTSQRVTELSGRGIGLDAVRETVQHLKGVVRVHSEAGRGTTVEICVPVSLSSGRALFMEVGGAPVGIPIEAVRRAFQIREESIARSGDSESIALDGEVLPLASLGRLLGRGSSPGRRAVWPAVVIQGGGRSAALSIDRLLGTSDVVMRPIPAVVQAEPVIAGATLDADGTPRLILEPAAVVLAATGLFRAPDEPARPRPRVLVVDDSLTTRMLEQSILESAGYDVDLASSGEEALEKAHRSRFDVFLVDVEMPGMDGYEFIRLSHEDPLVRGTPSILVTSRSSPEDRRRAERVGARAFITKDEFEQGVLLEHIRDLVR